MFHGTSMPVVSVRGDPGCVVRRRWLGVSADGAGSRSRTGSACDRARGRRGSGPRTRRPRAARPPAPPRLPAARHDASGGGLRVAAQACLHGTSPDQTAPAPSGPGRRLIVRRREEHRGTGAPGHARGTDVRAGHVRRPRHRPGRPPGHARRGDPAGGGRGGAGRRARPGLLRRRRAPPRRLRGLGARRGARGDRGPHVPHPARHQRDGAQLRRPDPGVRAVLHRRRALGRPGRGHPGPRVVHRVLPAVRHCAWRTTRCCSPRSSTCSPRCSRSSR